jgi:hypothetical protein
VYLKTYFHRFLTFYSKLWLKQNITYSTLVRECEPFLQQSTVFHGIRGFVKSRQRYLNVGTLTMFFLKVAPPPQNPLKVPFDSFLAPLTDSL